MEKQYIHICKGTCSRQIELKYDPESLKIIDIDVVGGCNGNLKGIKALVQGADMKDTYNRLKDIKCGPRATSCPAQLALTIEEALAQDGIELNPSNKEVSESQEEVKESN